VAAATAIQVRDLRKHYGPLEAVRGIDLQVAIGEVFALLGPNGAGKTTTIRMLATLLRPDAGSARILGHDVVREADTVRGLVSLTGQLASVDEDLTGRENLILIGRLLGLKRQAAKARATELLEAFGIADASGRLVKNYSGGMRRRLDVAASLVGKPDVLFLDEPTTGLDPRSRIDVWDFIREMQDEGTTLLLTTQYLEEADQLADRIAVIDVGSVIAEGTSDELKDRIGGEVLELHVVDRDDANQVAQLLQGVGTGEANVDTDQGAVRLPVGSDGPAALLDTVRRLDDTKIELADIALHRPTLDDVFLSLTGRVAEDASEPEQAEPEKKRGRRGRREKQKEHV